jgi:hypothetical protein
MSIVTLKPFGPACLGQQRLGLVDVELVGVDGAGTQQADRQEVLVHMPMFLIRVSPMAS